MYDSARDSGWEPGKEVDVEGFARELREYILPEILDAYLSVDRETLKGWCNEAVSRTFSLSPGERVSD